VARYDRVRQPVVPTPARRQRSVALDLCSAAVDDHVCLKEAPAGGLFSRPRLKVLPLLRNGMSDLGSHDRKLGAVRAPALSLDAMSKYK
jgi:hypothetical protein